VSMHIIELQPSRSHLHGATLAQQDLSRALSALSDLNGDSAVFLLNLSNATSVTGSYLRATLHWALLCGQAAVSQPIHPLVHGAWAVKPLPLFPMVVAPSAAVAEEVHDFFGARNLPLLQALKWTKSEITSARLVGALDSFLLGTLLKLAQFGEATAGELADKSKEAITPNAWSNRLAALFMLRLVTRNRAGKFWKYAPIAKEVQSWG
jgi:hypothetical protein